LPRVQVERKSTLVLTENIAVAASTIFTVARMLSLGSQRGREVEAIFARPLPASQKLPATWQRLPLRGKSGETDLILSCSSEVGDGDPRDFDERHEIVSVFEQEFFDIGAVLPEFKCPPAP
jgi:hypothetical protein